MFRFFSRPRPFLMQALGGLIAVVIMVPVITALVITALNSKSETAATYALPPATPATTGNNGSGTSNVTQAGTKTYTIKEQPGNAAAGFVFAPAGLTIHAGDIVQWVDVNAVPHNIVGTDSAAQSVIKRTAINTASYTVSFNTPGTYHYQCQIHPGMNGVITVLPKSGKEPTSTNHSGVAGGSSAVTVSMQPGNAAAGFVFAPATLSIHVGTTVKWVDANTVPHNIVGTDATSQAVINRTAIETNSYSVTFKTKGTYHYQCQIHPGMVGVITVS